MSVYSELAERAESMSTQQLLEHLILERFPGGTVVTASLRARSVAVLKMVADIDNTTPVVFCHTRDLFDESKAYRDTLISHLGLTHVTQTRGERMSVDADDTDHHECLWSEDPTWGGRVHETIHLNKVLEPYDCWISAVYHKDRHPSVRERVDLDGRLIKVDPQAAWSQNEITRFLKETGVPLHPRARKTTRPDMPEPPAEAMPSWCF